MSSKKVLNSALSLSQVIFTACIFCVQILNIFFQFMHRQKVLNLYRKFFRITKNLENDFQKQELREWVRSEFKTKTRVTDKVRQYCLVFIIKTNVFILGVN